MPDNDHALEGSATGGRAVHGTAYPDKQSSHDVFIARQPIFDHRKKVYGYELLFRSGLENACPDVDGNDASRTVVGVAWLDLGLETIVGHKLPFINLTQDLLLSGFVRALPFQSLVVELLENIEPSDDVVAACKDLKRHSYILALDDFVYRAEIEPLLALADIVKIRFGECDPEKQRDHVRRVAGQRPKLLAEKVETIADYERAVALGFDYFQGWFFCRPEIITGRALTGSRLTYLRLIQAVSRPEMSIDEIDRIIGSDISITHRFMKYLGSAAFGWRQPLRSVHQALVLLGEGQTRRWVSLISLAEISRDKPQELLVNATVRAKFCDELAGELGMEDRRPDLFLTGAFSLIDTMLDQSMADVLVQLPLSEELKTALTGGQNALRPVLEFAEAYERGDWPTCTALGARLGLDEARVSMHYRNSVAWAMESFGAAS